MKMNRAENRNIMKTLLLRGVPTIIFINNGEEFSARLVGDTDATVENIEKTLQFFLNKNR
jgi:thiol:disulfide interchange protein